MMATMNGDGGNGRSLPDGWEWSTLADCVDILDGRRVPINSGEREQRIAGKEQSELIPYYGSTGHVGWIDDFIFDEEILLLGEDAAPFLELTKDKAYVVRGKSWVNNHAHVLRAKSGITTNLFLKHYLNIFDYHEYVTGTTRLKLNQGRMRVMPVPLAPLPEQERIVNRIEELLSDLEAGVAALERVRAGLKRYKASVLKSAFEGKLQKQDDNDEDAHDLINRIMHERQVQWEANIRARGKDPKKVAYEELQFPNTDELTELPKNWQWVTWEMILANEDGAFRRGPFGSTLKKSIFVQSGFKVYEQYCAINDDCSFGRYYITPELFEELKSFEVKPGDYLISCSGVTLGRITRVPENSERGIINQALLRVRINNNIIEHKYFLHYFRSPYFQKKLFDSSTGTAIPNVKGVKELKALPIPLPPLDEQRRIVAEVERRLSVVGEVESAVAVGLVCAGRLRQSVLRSAFEGKL